LNDYRNLNIREFFKENGKGNHKLKAKRVMTFGTFDLFHFGHLRILQRARGLGDELIVGVSSDELNLSKKKKYPVFSQEHRMAIVGEIKGVTSVFVEDSLELKRQYITEHKADILVMGDDWKGEFDELGDICEVVYLERTPELSTTEYKHIIRNILDSF
jgi:glycerol-3-phosphate cytidylyltransferase